jgi:acyl-CoA synthetase (AMP-forming)/AMP-acid ligase II
VLSYLDAKYSLSHDLTNLLYPLIATNLQVRHRERRGTINLFYRIESIALDPSPNVQNRVFLYYEGKEWSYREAYDLVLRYATWLSERYGVTSRQVVAIDFTNKPAFLWLWMGLCALGATPAFINYNLEGERLVHCVRVSTTGLLFVDDEVAGSVLTAETREKLENAGERRIVVFDDATAAVVATWRGVRPPDEERNYAKLTDTAILIYTSGTTGMPKPAIISYRKVNSIGFPMRWLGLRKTDRFYTSMPLYHSSASLFGVANVLFGGCTLVLGHKFSTKRTLPELRESRATVFQYVGETCRYLLSSPPSADDKNHNLRIAVGNGLRPDVWKAFKDRFNIPVIAEFYASTEGMSASLHYQRGEFGIGAIGRNGLLTQLLLSHTTKIVKLDFDTEFPARDPATGFCKEVATGGSGEVIWRLDPDDIKSRFQGYYGNPEATDSKILRDVFKKGDAWFRTGDLQRRNKDGLWYFVDRIGDTFRWKSENISTAEVAAVVGSHPLVEECAVYGVPLPGHDGKAGCAAVVLRNGPGGVREFLEGLESCVKGLPKYARPVFVRVVESLERTGNNKIIKNRLTSEGVDMGKGTDGIWWCPVPGEGYKKFGGEEWKMVGRAKL